MEILNAELKFPITFERNTTETALQLALRGLNLKKSQTLITKTSTDQLLSIKAIDESLLKVSGLPVYSLDEVSQHQTCKSCWIVLYDRVYDVTSFLKMHPGGHDVLFENAGRDATMAFHGHHSTHAVRLLKDYLIGELPEAEKLYRQKSSHSISLTDMPE